MWAWRESARKILERRRLEMPFKPFPVKAQRDDVWGGFDKRHFSRLLLKHHPAPEVK